MSTFSVHLVRSNCSGLIYSGVPAWPLKDTWCRDCDRDDKSKSTQVKGSGGDNIGLPDMQDGVIVFMCNDVNDQRRMDGILEYVIQDKSYVYPVLITRVHCCI